MLIMMEIVYNVQQDHIAPVMIQLNAYNVQVIHHQMQAPRFALLTL